MVLNAQICAAYNTDDAGGKRFRVIRDLTYSMAIPPFTCKVVPVT
jgi:hypothetical protein